MRTHATTTIQNPTRSALEVRLGAGILASLALSVAAVLLLVQAAPALGAVAVVLALGAGVYTTVMADSLVNAPSVAAVAAEPVAAPQHV